MTDSVRIAVFLAVSVPALTALAGALAMVRQARASVPVLLFAAVCVAIAGIVELPSLRLTAGSAEAPVAVWSSLGLYGASITVRTHASGSLLALPAIGMALCGWLWAYGWPWSDPQSIGIPSRRALSDGSLLLAVASASWALIAGDLVSVVLSSGAFFVATAGAIYGAASIPAARRRLIAGGGFSLVLLLCVLLLSKVNGTFLSSQLASVSFSDASLAGLTLAAVGASGVFPTGNWMLRLARQPLMPAVALAGNAIAISLLDVAFVTTSGDLADAWLNILTGIGWIAIIGGVVAFWRNRRPAIKISAIIGARNGLAFLALGSGTPATMSSLALLSVTTFPALALFWVFANAHGRNLARGSGSDLTAEFMAASLGARGPERPALIPQGRQRLSLGRADVWVLVVLAGAAVGLPGTIGGIAIGGFLSGLSVASDRGAWARFAIFALDASVIAGVGSVIAMRFGIGYRAVLGVGGRRPDVKLTGAARGVFGATSREPLEQLGAVWTASARSGNRSFADALGRGLPWVALISSVVVIIGPALFPGAMVSPWFGSVSMAVAGTSTAPRLAEFFRFASTDRLVLLAGGFWGLWRLSRAEEWLPSALRTVVGIGVVIVQPVGFVARRASNLGKAALEPASRGIGSIVDRLPVVMRLVEDRYYSAVAVIAIVVLLYSIGR